MSRRGIRLLTIALPLALTTSALADDPAPASTPDTAKPADHTLSGPAKPVPRVPRKTLRVAGQWNLTAEKHDHAEMEGQRTKLLVSTGHPTLKHGPDMFRGPWDVDAHADRIEADFAQKKFILRGSPAVVSKDPKTHTTLKSLTGTADTVIEIGFADLKIAVTAGEAKDEASAPTVTDGK